ncbi:MAG: Sucraseferredoxin family protein, partial [Frankiales bacterium]|nr:Sucraseferredoxin family protein [Frankiales bacterium]
MTDLCSVASQVREEPPTATASRVTRWLLVEHSGAWGPESVPSGRMPVSVARALARTATDAQARLLLLRRPAGQPRTSGRWVYAVDSQPGAERVLARHVTVDAELVELAPPYGPAAAEGWDVVEGPL